VSVEAAFEVGRLYGPIKAISDILTSPGKEIFIGLPGIEGYYPMSVVGASGDAINHSGIDAQLTQVGTAPLGYDGNSFRSLGSGTNYFSKSSLYGLTGLETFIDSALRGFTIGGWFFINSFPSGAGGLISRDGIATNRGYVMFIGSTGAIRVLMSGNGTSVFFINSADVPLTEWLFIVARYIPSTEISVFVNGVKTTNTTSIPASCFVSTQDFEVGRYFNADANIVDAKVRDVFICRSALSDALIEGIRTATAPE